MRVVVIGGTGHIGSYLTPQLVEAGHATVCVSRSKRRPYLQHQAWSDVEHVSLNRDEAGFEARVAALAADAMIDLTCYTPESAQRLVSAVKGRVEHLLHCGTIWVHGPATEVPTAENDDREPISDYGRRKAEIENFLLSQRDVRCTVIHPGHLVGEGWVPLNPAGNFDPRVFADLAAGRTENIACQNTRPKSITCK